MLKNFIEGIKDVLPAVAGTIGYAVAGPAGAAIGSGLGSLVRGDEGQQALQNAMLAGALGYGGQRFLSGGSGPIGQFFSQGKIPGIVGGDTGILKAFSERQFSPFMKNIGFGGKYLPSEQGSQIIDRVQQIQSQKGAELNEIIKSGASIEDKKLATDLVNKKYADMFAEGAKDPGIMSKFLQFATTNPELILGGLTLAQTSGFFDEGELDELPRGPEPGSQGSLPTGIAQVVQPVAGEGGLFSYNMAKDGGIMHAKEGEQADSLSEEDQALLNMLRQKTQQKFLDDMKNESFRMQTFENPQFTPEGRMTIGAAQGRMMDGSISNFQENSPRRDLFLEREGPISDDRGSPNKDTVYAKLADGEFVVNANTVADIGYGMGARNLADAKDLGGSFFYGLQDAQKKGILGNMVGMA
jgi:hypothetical protein